MEDTQPEAMGQIQTADMAGDSRGGLVAANRSRLFEFIEPTDASQRGAAQLPFCLTANAFPAIVITPGRPVVLGLGATV